MSGPGGQDQPPERPGPRVRHLAGRKIIFDEEGFIKDPDDWDEELAALLATECGLDNLSEVHWRVLRFLRGYYLHHGRAPLNRQLKEGVGLSVMELERLFPGGIRQGCRRLAGPAQPQVLHVGGKPWTTA